VGAEDAVVDEQSVAHAFGMLLDRRLRLVVGLRDRLPGRGLVLGPPLELRRDRRSCLIERLERWARSSGFSGERTAPATRTPARKGSRRPARRL
jgi:hypothetical protein